MTIDIDKLTEAELIDLNHRVVARLKFLQQMRAHAHMLDFSIGQRVSFQPEGQPLLTGIIAKYNRKTVTVITESGQQWRVAPVFLCKPEPPSGPEPASAKVSQTFNRQVSAHRPGGEPTAGTSGVAMPHRIRPA